MLEFAGSPWTGALVAIVATLVAVGLWLRYRALERAGNVLPPGTGGARMVGTDGTVVAEHVPGTRRGLVLVLGDEWAVADAVASPLAVGDRVRVLDVVGTRLVVERTETPAAAPEADRGADTDDVRTQ